MAAAYRPIFASERSRYSHFVPCFPARTFKTYNTCTHKKIKYLEFLSSNMSLKFSTDLITSNLTVKNFKIQT